MNFSHMKVSTRLIATFSILLLMVLSLSIFVYAGISSAQKKSASVTDTSVPTLQALADMSAASMAMRITEMKYSYQIDIKNSPDEASDAEASMKESMNKFVDALHRYNEHADTDEKKAFADKIAADWTATEHIHSTILQLAQQQKTKQLNDLFTHEALKTRAAVHDSLGKLWLLETKQTNAISVAIKSSFETIQWMLIVGCAIALLFAAVAGWWLMRYVLQAFSNTIVVSKRIASGNLVEPVRDAHLRNEVGALLNSMEEMRTSLARTVASVRENADGVASASEQISRGNADLSTRTEEQASALEETASAMEELSATIKQNTDNAMNADRLAQDASKVANDGGEIVKRVVKSMQGINEGATRVVEVISLLDSIAFQTNLLALNASVEAARAGEQGRGFAVVASEVRNLAQRSAEASREIGGLITESVNNIRSGTDLANEAGGTIDEVVRSVNSLKDIMGEISAASYEQNQGVSQVSMAVTQMDQTTQQNAALVEESAAAASNLYDQARVLQETVQVFKINTSLPLNARQPSAAPRASSAPAARSKPAPKAQPAPTASSHDDNSDWETF